MDSPLSPSLTPSPGAVEWVWMDEWTWCLLRCGAGWRSWMECFSKKERGGIKVKLQWGKAWSAKSEWSSSLAVKPLQRAFCKCTLAQCMEPPGPLSPSLLLSCDFSQTVTHGQTDTHFLLIPFSYLDLTDFLSSNTIQQLAICHYKATCISGRPNMNFPRSHTNTTEITALHHAEFKQWGDSDGDSVTSDSERLRFIFLFCLRSSLLLFLCPFWMSHWEDEDRLIARPGSARSYCYRLTRLQLSHNKCQRAIHLL